MNPAFERRSLFLIIVAMTAQMGLSWISSVSFSQRHPARAILENPSILQTSLSAATSTDEAVEVWTEDQINEFANNQGIILSLTTLGPGYRAICRAQHNTSLILGYVEGFTRGNILHMDKMEVYEPLVARARAENPQIQKGPWLGVGLLLAYLCLLHGQASNCQQAEFLAIDDADFQHKRLVRLYKVTGFEVVKYVGDDLQDIPDRLIWGGCGTLMKQQIPVLLRNWSKLFRKNAEKYGNQA